MNFPVGIISVVNPLCPHGIGSIGTHAWIQWPPPSPPLSLSPLSPSLSFSLSLSLSHTHTHTHDVRCVGAGARRGRGSFEKLNLLNVLSIFGNKCPHKNEHGIPLLQKLPLLGPFSQHLCQRTAPKMLCNGTKRANNARYIAFLELFVDTGAKKRLPKLIPCLTKEAAQEGQNLAVTILWAPYSLDSGSTGAPDHSKNS